MLKKSHIAYDTPGESNKTWKGSETNVKELRKKAIMQFKQNFLIKMHSKFDLWTIEDSNWFESSKTWFSLGIDKIFSIPDQ